MQVINVAFRENVEKAGFCLTPTASAILNFVELVHAHGTIGILVGDPGVGKTWALSHYARQVRGTFHIVFMPSSGGLNASVARIAEAIDASTAAIRPDDLTGMIINRILRHPHPVLLMLDEAQNLNDLAIDQVRSIHDATACSVVFCGNDEFRTRFNKSKKASFGQFTQRVGPRLDLKTVSKDDIIAVAHHHGVHDRKAIAILIAQAEAMGNLRRVGMILDFAGSLDVGQGDTTLTHIERAIALLGG